MKRTPSNFDDVKEKITLLFTGNATKYSDMSVYRGISSGTVDVAHP